MDAAAIRYVLASLLSVVITLGVPIVMVELGGFDPSQAAATALLLALVANFLVLKFYVYRNDGRWQAQAVRYLLVAASFRLGEYFVFLALYKACDAANCGPARNECVTTKCEGLNGIEHLRCRTACIEEFDPCFEQHCGEAHRKCLAACPQQ